VQVSAKGSRWWRWFKESWQFATTMKHVYKTADLKNLDVSCSLGKAAKNKKGENTCYQNL